MVHRKQRELTQGEKSALTQKASHTSGLLAIAEEANITLAITDRWRTLTPEHRELVLYRVTGGETVVSICKQLSIEPGLIYMAAYLDEEFGQRLATARALGQHALVDRLLSIPSDETLSTERSKLLSDNIKWIAGRLNRPDYGDKLAIDARIQTVPVMLPIEAIPHED